MFRRIVICLPLTLLLLTVAEAQQAKKVPWIAYLGLIEIPERDDAFRKGLRERGYIEGQNIHVEYRFAAGRIDRLKELAAELVRLKVDVIITTGTPVTEAAKRATSTIPIVFTVVTDPVGSGFVTSLAGPSGNITGFSTLNVETAGKRVELLKEVKPRISRVAVLQNPANSASPPMFKETEAAAKRLGIRLQSLEIRSPDDLVGAFQAATREQAGALVGLPDNLLASQQRRIRDFAIKIICRRFPGRVNGWRLVPSCPTERTSLICTDAPQAM